ncbi:MAG: ribonuclease R, partial [Pseudomonadales bacterium]
DTTDVELSIGQIVEVELTQARKSGMFCGRIDKVLAEEMSPDIEIEVALRNHDIPFEFPNAVQAEIKGIKNHLGESDLKHREDLRHLPFVTIDGEDAKDFDDAVFAEPLESGFRLWVAIADVAHYVKPGSPLESEAINRGTSVYFPQFVVPMLPEKLSNGLCSLKPLEDRLAVVCVMDFDASGRRVAFKFLEAVIQSSARLIYEDVATCLADVSVRNELGEPIAQNLTTLLSVYERLQARRAKRGALEIETAELNIEWDASGALSVMAQRVRTDAHKLIEECMLAANVAMADLIAASGQFGLYRVHDEPDAERVTRLTSVLSQFGIAFDVDQDKVTTQNFQKVLDASRDQPAGAVLQMLILRTMNQAIYTPDRRQHFGLNYEGYAHFTSPIRRLADLLNHRLVKSVVAAERSGKQLASPLPSDEAGMQALGEQASLTERRADAAVFEVLEWLKCEYLKKYLGDSFEGVITTAVKFGLFVNIEPMMAEGLIHVSSMTDDHYQFDQDRGALIGSRTGRVFSLGDRVVVQIDRVEPALGQVSLSLCEHRPLHRRGESSGRSPKKRGQKPAAGRTPGKRKRSRRG